MQSVQADNWKIDATTQWQNAEISSHNITYNNTGHIQLHNTSTLSLYPNGDDTASSYLDWGGTDGSCGSSGGTYSTELDETVLNTADYVETCFKGTSDWIAFDLQNAGSLTNYPVANVTIYTICQRESGDISHTLKLGIRKGGSNYLEPTGTNIGTSQTTVSYTWSEDPADNNPWTWTDINTSSLVLYDTAGGGSNYNDLRIYQSYIVVTVYTEYDSVGYWNSSWHDWGNTMVINDVNFSINDTGGGLTYKIDVSDDGAVIKDTSGWDTIAATGYVMKYPSVDSAQYVRVRFNLTNGSTPIIDFFDFDASENATPNIVSTVPVDGTEGVDTSITQINVTINDAEGDTFNWSIETSPDIGDSNANNENNGTKTCAVAGLVGGTTYTVYVNVTDAAGNILNYTFSFITFGSVEFWCFDETDPSTGIPFGLEISNSHFYVNYSLTNGDNISIANLPFGDNVVFFVNSTGYVSRMYTYTISAVDDYNFTFYLPPEKDDEFIRYASTTVLDPSSNVDITLICEPSWVVMVQGWNESLYGHWFTIPDANYTLSGDTITVSSDVLDDNTSLVQAQYYCDNDALDYLVHVIDPKNDPVKQAKIIVNRLYDTNLTEVGSSLTDGNGDTTISLIPGVNYIIIINKTGYENESANFIPTINIRTKTYKLEYNLSDTYHYDFNEHILFNGTMYKNGTIECFYYNDLLTTTDVQLHLYEIYNGTDTFLNTTNTTLSSWLNQTYTGANTSRLHYVELWFNHTKDFDVTCPVVVFIYPSNFSNVSGEMINATNLEEHFTYVFGENELGWGNTIAVFAALIMLVVFGPFNAGLGVIGSGVTLACVELVFVLNNGLIAIVIPIIIAIGVFYILVMNPEVHL